MCVCVSLTENENEWLGGVDKSQSRRKRGAREEEKEEEGNIHRLIESGDKCHQEGGGKRR